MELIVGIAAAIGFAIALCVHVLTFFPGAGITPGSPMFFALHIGLFAVFVPYVLALRSQFGAMPQTWRTVLVPFPRWAQAVIIVTFAYVIANFALFMFSIGGTPEIRDGQYVLMNHGTLVRKLTHEEYDALRSRVTRGFSGHWLLFYLIPALYFLFASKTKSQSSSPGVNN